MPDYRSAPLRILVLILAAAQTAGAQNAAQAPAQAPAQTPAQTAAPLTYTNLHYRFRLTLPSTWKGYTVRIARGQASDTTVSPDAVPAPPKQTYTVITLRHPRWTRAHPHEDLPIMIFTPAQWERIADERLVVGAAPFPPGELAHNSRYVFALPARYNFDYADGWQELESLLKTHPLRAF